MIRVVHKLAAELKKVVLGGKMSAKFRITEIFHLSSNKVWVIAGDIISGTVRSGMSLVPDVRRSSDSILVVKSVEFLDKIRLQVSHVGLTFSDEGTDDLTRIFDIGEVVSLHELNALSVNKSSPTRKLNEEVAKRFIASLYEPELHEPASEKALRKLKAAIPNLAHTPLFNLLATTDGLSFGLMWNFWSIEKILDEYDAELLRVEFCDVMANSELYAWTEDGRIVDGALIDVALSMGDFFKSLSEDQGVIHLEPCK